MRNLHLLDTYRFLVPGMNPGDDKEGAFQIPSPIDGAPLRIIAAVDMGWDHVSVSRKNRCPNWPEMEFVKRLCFRDEECAMQLHVPAKDHISYHPHTLHLWRPHDVEIPRPPSIMVGPTEDQIAEAGITP